MSGFIQCNHMNANGYKCEGYAIQGSKYCQSHVHLMTGYVQNSVSQTVQQAPIQQVPIQQTNTSMNCYPNAMQSSSRIQQVLDHHSMIAKAIHEQYAMSASYQSYHPMVMQMSSYPQLVPIMTAYGVQYVMQ